MARLLVAATVPYTLEVFLIPYAQAFRRMGWSVDALANGVGQSEACIAGFDRTIDVGMSRSPAAAANIAAIPAIRRAMRAGDYDIVHVHTPIAGLAVRLAGASLGKRRRPSMVYTAHGFHFHDRGDRASNAAFATAEFIAGRFTDATIVINETDRRAALRMRLAQEQSLHLFPGIGFDASRWNRSHINPEDVASVLGSLGLSRRDPIVSIVAELNTGKRHRDLLRAATMTKNRRIHILVAGEGPERRNLEVLATDLGIRDRVHFLGFRRDMPAVILASTVMVLPSEREGLPLSIIEAQSLGVPVIGTSVRGIEDLLGDGRGVLVPLGSPRALAHAIDRVVSAPEFVREMTIRGMKAATQYEFERVLGMHIELYEHLLDRRLGHR